MKKVLVIHVDKTKANLGDLLPRHEVVVGYPKASPFIVLINDVVYNDNKINEINSFLKVLTSEDTVFHCVIHQTSLGKLPEKTEKIFQGCKCKIIFQHHRLPGHFYNDILPYLVSMLLKEGLPDEPKIIRDYRSDNSITLELTLENVVDAICKYIDANAQNSIIDNHINKLIQLLNTRQFDIAKETAEKCDLTMEERAIFNHLVSLDDSNTNSETYKKTLEDFSKSITDRNCKNT